MLEPIIDEAATTEMVTKKSIARPGLTDQFNKLLTPRGQIIASL
jgi:hypothetical protein